MFGRPSPLTALQSRKQLLLAESELNRVQLKQDWQAARQELGALASQARNISCIVAIGTALVGGLAAWRRHKSAPKVVEKTSWISKMLKGAALASTIWAAVRPPPRK